MQPSFVYLHYFRSPLTFTSKEMYPLEKCQMFYTSRSQLNINLDYIIFFQMVIWTNVFEENYRAKQIFISPADRTDGFRQLWDREKEWS